MSDFFNLFTNELNRKYGKANCKQVNEVFDEVSCGISTTKIDDTTTLITDIDMKDYERFEPRRVKYNLGLALSNSYTLSVLLGNDKVSPLNHMYTATNTILNRFNVSVYKHILDNISYSMALGVLDNFAIYDFLDAVDKYIEKNGTKNLNYSDFMKHFFKTNINVNESIKYNKFKNTETYNLLDIHSNDEIINFNVNAIVSSESFINLVDFKITKDTSTTLCLLETYMCINNFKIITKDYIGNDGQSQEDIINNIKITRFNKAYVKISIPVIITDYVLKDKTIVTEEFLKYRNLENIFLRDKKHRSLSLLQPHKTYNKGLVILCDFINIKIYLPTDDIINIPKNMEIVDINNEKFAIYNTIWWGHTDHIPINFYNEILDFSISFDDATLQLPIYVMPSIHKNKHIIESIINYYKNFYFENNFVNLFIKSEKYSKINLDKINYFMIKLFDKLSTHYNTTSTSESEIFRRLYIKNLRFVSKLYKSANLTFKFKNKNNIKLTNCLKNMNVMSVWTFNNESKSVTTNIVVDNKIFKNKRFLIDNLLTSHISGNIRGNTLSLYYSNQFINADLFRFSIFNPYGFDKVYIETYRHFSSYPTLFPGTFNSNETGKENENCKFVMNPFISDDLNKHIDIRLDASNNKLNIKISKSLVKSYIDKIKLLLKQDNEFEMKLMHNFILSTIPFLTPNLINLYNKFDIANKIKCVTRPYIPRIKVPFSKYITNDGYFNKSINYKNNKSLNKDLFQIIDNKLIINNNSVDIPNIAKYDKELFKIKWFSVISRNSIMINFMHNENNNELIMNHLNEVKRIQRFVLENLANLIGKNNLYTIFNNLITSYNINCEEYENNFEIVSDNIEIINEIDSNLNQLFSNIFGTTLNFKCKELKYKFLYILSEPEKLIEFANSILIGYNMFRIFMDLLQRDFNVEDIYTSVKVDNKWVLNYIFNNLLYKQYANIGNNTAIHTLTNSYTIYNGLHERVYALLNLCIALNLNYNYETGEIKFEALPINELIEIAKNVFNEHSSTTTDINNYNKTHVVLPRLIEKAIEEYLRKNRKNTFNLAFFIPIIDRFMANMSKVSASHIDKTLNALLEIEDEILHKKDAYDKISKLALQANISSDGG